MAKRAQKPQQPTSGWAAQQAWTIPSWTQVLAQRGKKSAGPTPCFSPRKSPASITPGERSSTHCPTCHATLAPLPLGINLVCWASVSVQARKINSLPSESVVHFPQVSRPELSKCGHSGDPQYGTGFGCHAPSASRRATLQSASRAPNQHCYAGFQLGELNWVIFIRIPSHQTWFCCCQSTPSSRTLDKIEGEGKRYVLLKLFFLES